MSVSAVIRMKGRFSLSPTIRSTLESLSLGKLYSCTLVQNNDSSKGMLQAAKDVVSFGQIDKASVLLLLSKRGKDKDGKKLSLVKKPEEISKIAEAIVGGKNLREQGVRPYFSLSPPKGGFGSRKEQSPAGPLGKNEKIAELIESMA